MDDKNKKPSGPWSKSLLIWVGVLFGLVLFAQLLEGGTRAQAGNPITYSDFIRQVGEGNVRQVTTSAAPSGNQTISGKLANGESFRTTAPSDAQVTERTLPSSTWRINSE